MSKIRRIVVTGASSGIGRELALQLAAPDTSIWLVGRDAGRLGEVAGLARKSGAKAIPVSLDLTDLDASARFLREELGNGSNVDEAYLAAAVSIFGEVKDLRLEDWRKIYQTDLLSCAQWVREIYGGMVERRQGLIVMVASLAAYAGYPTSVPYAAMKAGLVGLCRSLCSEARRYGVRFHLANPGFVDTEIYRRAIFRNTNYEETMASIRSTGFRIITPEEAARKILKAVGKNRRSSTFPFYAVCLKWFALRMPAVLKPIHRSMVRKFRASFHP